MRGFGMRGFGMRGRAGWRLMAPAAAVLAGLMLLAAAATAQTPPPPQSTPPPSAQPSMAVLTINQEALYAKSLYGERVKRERAAETAALSAENRKIEAALSAEELDLTKKRRTMDAKAFRKLADAFDKKVQGIRRAQDGKARALVRQQEAERQKFFARVLPILMQILRDRHADAILDRRAILVASDKIDITEDALARIDATLGDGTGQ